MPAYRRNFLNLPDKSLHAELPVDRNAGRALWPYRCRFMAVGALVRETQGFQDQFRIRRSFPLGNSRPPSGSPA